jgi:hypothetical protein
MGDVYVFSNESSQVFYSLLVAETHERFLVVPCAQL